MLARSLGECLGKNVMVFRVPAAFPPGCLVTVLKPPQGLDTDITLPHTLVNALQMAPPRAAI